MQRDLESMWRHRKRSAVMVFPVGGSRSLIASRVLRRETMLLCTVVVLLRMVGREMPTEHRDMANWLYGMANNH